MTSVFFYSGVRSINYALNSGHIFTLYYSTIIMQGVFQRVHDVGKNRDPGINVVQVIELDGVQTSLDRGNVKRKSDSSNRFVEADQVASAALQLEVSDCLMHSMTQTDAPAKSIGNNNKKLGTVHNVDWENTLHVDITSPLIYEPPVRFRINNCLYFVMDWSDQDPVDSRDYHWIVRYKKNVKDGKEYGTPAHNPMGMIKNGTDEGHVAEWNKKISSVPPDSSAIVKTNVHFIPPKTGETFEIGQYYLSKRLMEAEALDYDFALRMQVVCVSV